MFEKKVQLSVCPAFSKNGHTIFYDIVQVVFKRLSQYQAKTIRDFFDNKVRKIHSIHCVITLPARSYKSKGFFAGVHDR